MFQILDYTLLLSCKPTFSPSSCF